MRLGADSFLQDMQPLRFDDALRQLVGLVNSSVRCECIYLHGSRATGEGLGARSDYDLMAVAKTSSILGSRRRLFRLRRILQETSPAKVELTLLTPQSVARARDSLLLMAWGQEAKLIHGGRDVLNDLRVGSFVPSEKSVRDLTCFTTERLLRDFRVDSARRSISVEKEGLQKVARFLSVHGRLAGLTHRGLSDLALSVRSETAKEAPDLRVISRACADYLEQTSEQFERSDLASQLPYLLTYHHFSRVRAFDALSQRQPSKSQFIRALACLFRSTETDPPSIARLQEASKFLRSSLAFEKVRPILRSGEDNPYRLWADVKGGIRRNWDTVMDYHYPFGRVLMFRPFRTVLA
jgi:predicted nucleotidyltransferase